MCKSNLETELGLDSTSDMSAYSHNPRSLMQDMCVMDRPLEYGAAED